MQNVSNNGDKMPIIQNESTVAENFCPTCGAPITYNRFFVTVGGPHATVPDEIFEPYKLSGVTIKKLHVRVLDDDW